MKQKILNLKIVIKKGYYKEYAKKIVLEWGFLNVFP